ncbi:MAG: Ala-tRNA(Pro) hydrolase [Acidobacteria bacterium]|nr:MAG: Ala-tRNA(Pro) hydrolase [Acidobacteriota bacterium]
MNLPPTIRLYWQDHSCFQTQALVLGVRDNALAFDQTCFYPGGGGQPHDSGTICFEPATPLTVTSIHVEKEEVIWHVMDAPNLGTDCIGKLAELNIDRERRIALTRYHTVLHILNTIALRDYGGWITGVQIATDYSRIDFKIENFSQELCRDIEQKVNAVIAADHSLKASFLPEEEFRLRTDLLRTLQVQPPVYNGTVRIVEIVGFDAQACGGTHVGTTGELGSFTIYKIENKGKINKRLYVRLATTSE